MSSSLKSSPAGLPASEDVDELPPLADWRWRLSLGDDAELARCDTGLFLYLLLLAEQVAPLLLPIPAPLTLASPLDDAEPLATAGVLLPEPDGEACEAVAVAVAAAMAVAFMVMLMLMLVWLLDELEGRKAVVLPFAADEERWWW